ncbi:hypothetical protein B0T14DRAFT_196543 [Immersiella caudata]|uniref:Rhodopsin domain-containing protein n=1 Tax=Immersiella caudata TaxID=314043 RepID=A0AA39WNS2_9PEZI|nr:hypothetical protein B0T14DRAFT_196543 [Immersiella caudata]
MMSKTITNNDTRSWENAFVIAPEYGPYPYSGLQIFGFAIIGFFPLLSLVVVALRVYSRRLVGGLALDDWLILLAMAIAIPQALFASFFLRSGYWGIHDADVPRDIPRNLGYFWNFINGLCANPTLALVKAAALIFLLRLGWIKRRVLIACRILIFLNLAHMTSFFLIFLFQCRPVHARWEVGGEAKCIRVDLLSIIMAIISILTDLLTLSVPFALFLDLRVSKKLRNSLIVVFLLGGVVTIISTVRLYYILRIYYIKVEDRHYSIGFVCGSVELNLAIVTASIPTLWPLGRKRFPSFFASLGANRPHLYPDIEVAYATTQPRTSRTSRTYKSKIVWKDKRTSPIEGGSASEGGGSSGWGRLPDMPDGHLFAKSDHTAVDDEHHLFHLAGKVERE